MKKLIIMALFITGCAHNLPSIKAHTVKKGYNSDQVTQIMGYPQNVKVQGVQELWQYCVTGMRQSDFAEILFIDGKVSRLQTKKLPSFGASCQIAFSTDFWFVLGR